MHKGQQAVLGAILAAPFLFGAARSAGAAPPPTGHYVYVPPGAAVVVLPGPAMTAAPVTTAPVSMGFPLAGMPAAGMPVAAMMARQDAMMQRMMADMNAMFAMPMPDPQRLIEAATHGLPAGGPGTGVFVTSVSSGQGVCSETITYGYPANGGKPVVHVAHSGNGCGAVTMRGPTTPAAEPIAPHVVPDTAPVTATPRLWTAGNTARPIGRVTHPGT